MAKKPVNPYQQHPQFYTRRAELDFKRWKDRRKAHDHIFITFQSVMLAIAVPLLIHRVIGIMFFGQ